MKYHIVPNGTVMDEITDAKDPLDAMEQFAARMDMDMNAYFKAVPVADNEPAAPQTLSSLLKRGLKAADVTLGRDLTILGKSAKEEGVKAKQVVNQKYQDFKTKRAEKSMKRTDPEMPSTIVSNEDAETSDETKQTETEDSGI